MENDDMRLTVGSVVAAALAAFARVMSHKHTKRINAVEAELFENLSAALRASEERMDEEREMFAKREAALEAQHQEYIEKIITLSTEFAAVRERLTMALSQNAELIDQIAVLRSDLRMHGAVAS